MQRISREAAVRYAFDAREDPVLRVKQGESFVIETEDAGSGLVRSEDVVDRMDQEWTRPFMPPMSNPMGGPVYVVGAMRGDLLEVTIERIEVDSQGFTRFGPDRTPIGNDHRWPDLNKPFVKIIPHLPGPSGTTRDGKGVFSDRVTWDLQPMIGCIGVAPDREVITSATGQAISGGNLDMRDVKEGTKVYLNVYHQGALLFIGDVHGSQGDTEYYGTADETRAEVQVSCRLVKRKSIPFIRLEKPESIVAVRAGKSLDTMVHQAVEDLIHWLVTDYGMDPREAYMHTCINPDFRVNVYQYTIGLASVGAELPKKYLV